MAAGDPAVLEAAARGDAAAFRTLLDRHGGRVYACAFRLTGDEAAAEEIVHDVFLAMVREAERFRRESSLATWLYRVTLNRCADHHRTHARHGRMQDLQSLEESMIDERPGPEELSEATERQAVLAAALRELPHDMQEVITLRFAAGLSYAEIASTLDCPAGSVASRLHRALGRLGESLSRHGHTPEAL